MKITIRKSVSLAVLLVSLCLSAQAGIINFNQVFNEAYNGGAGQFTRVEALSVDSTFYVDNTNGGTLVDLNPHFERWAFASTSSFTYLLAGVAQGTANVSLFAFNDDALVDYTKVQFDKDGLKSVKSERLNMDQYISIRSDIGAPITESATPTPEPATMGLLGSSLIGLGFVARRLRKR